jgi:hypothetical protein
VAAELRRIEVSGLDAFNDAHAHMHHTFTPFRSRHTLRQCQPLRQAQPLRLAQQQPQASQRTPSLKGPLCSRHPACSPHGLPPLQQSRLRDTSLPPSK